MRCTDAGEITAWASARSADERRPDAIVRQQNKSHYMDTGYNQQDQVRLHVEVRERVFGYMVGAFGLVAGLAWNEAIQASIAYLFPLPENTLPAKFLYAVVISIVVVVVSVYLSRLLRKFNSGS